MAKRRLKTLEDARRYLSHLVNAIEDQSMDPAIGGRLAYIVSILVRVLEKGDLENRLSALEERFGEWKRSQRR